MFEDRRDAGRKLGVWLREREVRAAIVLGLPRGGVPVAAEVARALGLPEQPAGFRAVGEHYRRFDQTTDAEVVAALTGQDRPPPPHAV